MLAAIVSWSIRARRVVIVALVVLIAMGIQAFGTLPIDAMPDVSTIQVGVLTTAPGLSALEVERTVTMPIEVALNGTPGMEKLRSVSRSGLSNVTVIFKDGTDVWFARQLVLERLRGNRASSRCRSSRTGAGQHWIGRDLPVRGAGRATLAHAA
ncbi:MAG: efflux RND transporter permease subunit [Polyangiaceae bacterium]